VNRNGTGTKKILICTYHVVQENVDSSSRRLAHFVDFLLDDGWQIAVAAKNPAAFDRRARGLRRRGIAVHPLQREALERLVATERFDVALVAFWHIAEPVVNLVRTLSPMTHIVVDSMDLHFLRVARQMFGASGGEGVLDSDYGRQMAREINVYAAADRVLAVSSKEAGLIDDLVGQAGLASWVPDCEHLEPSSHSFDDRSGMVIVGNYEHPPNVDAVAYFCQEIAPHLDQELLAAHPIRIVGNDLNAAVKAAAKGVRGIELVGWVPSVIPYLERSRISIVPLRYGAGTKRKLIQSLMLGTPAVTTSVGIEGLPVEAGSHILVADEPGGFARAIELLMTDRRTWQSLAKGGRERVISLHGREASKSRLLEAIASAAATGPKTRLIPQIEGAPWGLPAAQADYTALVRRLRTLVDEHVPEGTVVAVVSKGDPELLKLEGRAAWHFPREQSGEYAGYYPKGSDEAIAHLQELIAAGAEFLLVPETNLWWLDHYQGFRDDLESRFSIMTWQNDLGALFDLREPKSLRPAGLEADEPTSAIAKTSKEDADPSISVVIPTRDRAELLSQSLASLAAQTLPTSEFEVIVVDDGSSDHTEQVCRQWGEKLPLRRERLERSGIGTAKNVGAVAARAPIVFFFDDDDVADPNLLAEHVRAHAEHPDENVAVLGYTTWAPSLDVSEVMHFVTDVGGYLFKYTDLDDGQMLDFTYFWGGRASCKRSLLAKRGLFRPEFQFGCEDVELAYRLSSFGFRVLYRRQAVQYMNRPLSYEEFCARCERQGRAQSAFSRMCADEAVREYCGVDGAEARWLECEPLLPDRRARVAELEQLLATASESSGRQGLQSELWDLYWWSFDACKIKGIAEAIGVPVRQEALSS
jgi:hypothetical protein